MREGRIAKFDPFEATLEEAERQPDAHAARGAVMQWAGAVELVGRRGFYELNPLDGIAVCAMHDLVAPDWLARAYLRRYFAVRNCMIASWDDAFGRPVPKGRQLAAMKRDRKNRVRVALLVTDFVKHHPTEPLDLLWQEFDREQSQQPAVAERFSSAVRKMGVRSTKAQELFAEALHLGEGIDPRKLRQAQGYPAVPAKFRKSRVDG